MAKELSLQRSFNPEVNRYEEVKFGGCQHVALQRARLCAVHAGDGSIHDCVRVVDASHRVGAILLDLANYRCGCQGFNVRGDGHVFKYRDGDVVNAFHVGRRSRAQGVPSTPGEEPEQYETEVSTRWAIAHWVGSAGSAGGGGAASFDCGGVGWFAGG
jgi:hypothetical protein